MTYDKIVELIGKKEEYLFSHKCKTLLKEKLHLPGSDFIDMTFIHSNRNIQTLCNSNKIFKSGRLAGTGYLSVLPVHLSALIQFISILKIII
jgi:fructose-bisphosphate aldolase, class I